jgi:amino acid transporter
MPVSRVAMIIIVTTFGMTNINDNIVEMGLAAIPSWIGVAVLYFMPLALILAEFASDSRGETGGIYSYMRKGLGPTWAFVGAWSYFVSNLVFLQMAFSRLPIRVSLALTGSDAFESSAALLPFLGVAICLGLTFISTRGVGTFSHVAEWGARMALGLSFLLITVPLAVMIFGGRGSATPFSAQALTPAFDLGYFATFAWLLFAVSGAEVAAPYVKHVGQPDKDFPRAIITSTLLIATLYILGTISVAIAVPADSLTKATGMHAIWRHIAASVSLPPEATARVCMALLTFGYVSSYVVWMESPIRVMFADVPRGTFPAMLLRRNSDGTHVQALWAQALVVVTITLIPLISILAGRSGSENFISLLNDLSALALVVPYVFVALAYIQARRNGMDAPFKMVRSTRLAITIGTSTLVVSALGYFGAGLYALQADPVDWLYVGIIYAGPIGLTGLGLLLRWVSLARTGEATG